MHKITKKPDDLPLDNLAELEFIECVAFVDEVVIVLCAIDSIFCGEKSHKCFSAVDNVKVDSRKDCTRSIRVECRWLLRS